MLVLSVFGTRSEAIEMAPTVKELAQTAGIESVVAVTAQHRQMLDQVLNLFVIQPQYDLYIMQVSQDPFDVTSRELLGLRNVYQHCQPQMVLVHGDTTTCFAASLAAFYLRMPVGHVEAGLRTDDLFAPFPEEANRSLVGRFVSYHFAPTAQTRDSLLKEGVAEQSIWVTGNTVVDAPLDLRDRLAEIDPQQWAPSLPCEIATVVLNRSSRVILIIGHRRENFGQGFVDFCSAIIDIATRHPYWMLLYLVHLNPNVGEPVNKLLGEHKNICLIEPLDYLPFVWMLNQCDMVITDSGGTKEEAPSLGKPLLVSRTLTERPEAVVAGTVKLVGIDRNLIFTETESILINAAVYQSMADAHNPYGDGKAAQRIADVSVQ
jgi:UDP-N-acetylglucosamine 2-epimerase (non-hydrolysing)